VSSEMHLDAVIEPGWRYTLWSSLSKYGDALGGHERAIWEEYLQAVNGRHARCCHSIVSVCDRNSQSWECDGVTLSLSSEGELAGGSRSCEEARRKLQLHSWSTCHCQNTGKTESLG